MRKRTRAILLFVMATLATYLAVVVYGLLHLGGLTVQGIAVAIVMPLALAAIAFLGRPRKERRLRKKGNGFRLAPAHDRPRER